MITSANNIYNSPKRQVAAKVELYKGSTLANTFLNTDAIKDIKVSREGETNKFFGFGVCQKVEITLTDINRNIAIDKDDKLRVYFSSGGDYTTPFPTFYVTEAKRDENNNDIKIVAFDALNAAAARTVAELEMGDTYLLSLFASACAQALGLGLIYDTSISGFNVLYEGDANLTGSENFRTAIDAIAEATQTIYYVNSADNLVFKKLDKDGSAVLTITKSDYFTLTSGDRQTLSKIVSATELGDNVYVGDDSGNTQFVKDNPFWNLRDDLTTLLEAAYTNIGGINIDIYNCSWRGNPLLEYGDKIAIINKEDGVISSYLLSETLNYNGGLKSTIKWDYKEDKAQDAGASVTIGEVLNETYAKVDKINKQIDLVAKESSEATTKVAQMQITVNGITTKVEHLETTVDGYDNRIAEVEVTADEISGTVSQVEALANGNKEAIANLKITTEEMSSSISSFESVTNELGEEVSSIREEVSTKLTTEEATLIFQKEIGSGVDKVTTSTGFTFNEEGLTVSKSGTEMSTTITEDGMTVYKDGDEMLTASHEGVKAVDLHATTYLIIGENSRFEDYEKDGEARTGCFWIGG